LPSRRQRTRARAYTSTFHSPSVVVVVTAAPPLMGVTGRLSQLLPSMLHSNQTLTAIAALDADALAEGLAETDVEGDALPEGLADALGDFLALAEGEIDAEADGLTLALGLTLSDADGESEGEATAAVLIWRPSLPSPATSMTAPLPELPVAS
jgi:hypothetical protein